MENLTHEEISDKSGFGKEEIVSKNDELMDTPLKETKEEEKPKEEVKPEEKPKATEEVVEEEPKEEPKPKDKIQRTVPYGKLKAEREKVKELESNISNEVAKGVKEALASLIKADKQDDLPDPIKLAAKEIAEEEGLDEGGVEKILKKAKELSADNKLPKEVEDQLKELDALKKDMEETKKKQAEKEDIEKFNSEWDNFVVDIKKEYPNATDEMLKEAKEKMDDLAHSQEHHTHEMDYILFKEKKTFDTLLKVAPKSSNGETSKQVFNPPVNEDNEVLPNIEDMTPEMMKQREQRKVAQSPSLDGNSEDYADIQIIDPIEE